MRGHGRGAGVDENFMRLTGQRLRDEFQQHASIQRLFLRYTQARITQLAQTVVCNRHHSVDQQLCRWLLLSLDRLSSNKLTMTHDRIAAMAAKEGASALLVFPPNTMAMGGQLRPEMALVHFRRIADASNLPLICFQYPMASGLGYPFDTLLKLFDAVPSIRAIKDWSNDAMLHERHIRTFQNLPRPVNVLTTHSSWLMASLSMGANGLLSGAGSVIADLQVALFSAVRAGELKAAQAINDRIYPLAQAFYTPPFLDMHNRMKECLVLLGRIAQAHVRPPLVKITQAEIERLRQALNQAGIPREPALASVA